MALTPRNTALLAAAGSAALLLGAFVFQALGYAPCKLCIWQRWPHGAAILIGMTLVVLPVRVVAPLGALAALATAGVGIYHTGAERGWWEGPSTCTGAGTLGGMSGADLLATDGVVDIVRCDEVVWQFAGLSMASWNAVFSLCLAGLWAWAALKAMQGRSA